MAYCEPQGQSVDDLHTCFEPNWRQGGTPALDSMLKGIDTVTAVSDNGSGTSSGVGRHGAKRDAYGCGGEFEGSREGLEWEGGCLLVLSLGRV